MDQTKLLDKSRLDRLLVSIKDLHFQIKIAKSNQPINHRQIHSLETSLKIEKSKIDYICLAYDLPLPEEYSPQLQSIDSILLLKSDSGFLLQEEDNSDLLESLRISNESQQSEGSILNSSASDFNKKEKNIQDLIAEKKKQIEEIEGILIAMEDELSKFVSLENYDKAASIHLDMTKYTQKKTELLQWIDQNKPSQ